MQASTLRSVGLGLFVFVSLGLATVALCAEDGEDNNRLSVIAAFGSGLNTLPPPPALSGPPIITFCQQKSKSRRAASCIF